MNKNITIVLPSYRPDEKLEQTVNAFIRDGFDDILVIDDGGGIEYKEIFDRLACLDCCTVITHEVNRGKGAALKTAFKWYLKNRNGAGVVTADGDGQHKSEDVLRVANELVSEGDKVILGARDFTLPGIPERSKKGNRLTSRIFKLLFSMTITDTQTGLRGIPAGILERLCSISGDRYEYETNMLLFMKKNDIQFREVRIETVYINENETSHFRPVADSMRIYGMIFKYFFTGAFFKFIGSSGLCAVIDTGLFALFYFFISKIIDKNIATAVSYSLARAISSFVNYSINRRIFSGGDVKKTILKYYALAVCILLLGMFGVTYASKLITALPPIKAMLAGAHQGGAQTVLRSVVKQVVDMLLFIASYNIQKKVIFKKENT